MTIVYFILCFPKSNYHHQLFFYYFFKSNHHHHIVYIYYFYQMDLSAPSTSTFTFSFRVIIIIFSIHYFLKSNHHHRSLDQLFYSGRIYHSSQWNYHHYPLRLLLLLVNLSPTFTAAETFSNRFHPIIYSPY